MNENKKNLSLFEMLQQMTIEELAEWLYANVEYLSAEYGSCSGANDSSGILRCLKQDGLTWE